LASPASALGVSIAKINRLIARADRIPAKRCKPRLPQSKSTAAGKLWLSPKSLNKRLRRRRAIEISPIWFPREILIDLREYKLVISAVSPKNTGSHCPPITNFFQNNVLDPPAISTVIADLVVLAFC
jgi:hypothetical protein